MQSLAVKYRPKTFDEIVSQNYIKDILLKQVETNNLKNCYLFAGASGCVDKDTEYFTGTCWKRISDYEDGDRILVFDPKTRGAFLEMPQKYIKLPCDKFNVFKTKYGIDMQLSDEHTIVYETSKGHINTKQCDEFVKLHNNSKYGFDARFLTTFTYSGVGIDLTDSEIKLMCAVICDGSFRKDSNTSWCCVNLKKDRKINLLRSILQECRYGYKETKQNNGFTRFYFNAPRKEKEFTSYWYNCSNHQLQVICENILNWDGSITNNRKRFTQKNKSTIDFVQFAFTSCGYRSSIKEVIRNQTKIVNGKTYHYPNNHYYTLQITDTNKISLGRTKIIQSSSKDGFKYCFTVSTHMWVMRRNGNIIISGNCGKTTIARAFANLINKGKGSPIEIDAASHNSVDDVRDITEGAKLRSIDSEYKFYIIDECHSITTQGWQAFLKTIEEPPEKTIFMFCTTNPEKIPITIQNRVMRFNLTKIPTKEIRERLEYICQQENIVDKDNCCDYIAKLANGGMRDAIAYLEKVADYSKELTIENTLNILGSYSYDDFLELTNAVIDGKQAKVLNIIEVLDNNGKNLKNFVDEYMKFILDLNKYSLFKDISMTTFPISLEDKVKYAVSFDKNIDAFNLIIDSLLELKQTIRYDDTYVLTIKGYFIRILERIKELWKTL